MLHKSTIQLLRFHFSFFLLPVFLFAISQLNEINWPHALLIFFILHVLVYPSSNGYNSYMDRDSTPIGGLYKPLQPTRQLFYVSIILDIVAITTSFFLSIYFALGILLYIVASRAYSYRGIRLKKYPVAGYLVAVIFQGAVVFFLTYYGSNMSKIFNVPLLPMLAASCLIGGYYPLTQVYQHTEDRKDGVQTISLLMGKRGTFIYCGIIFAIATLLIFITFKNQGNLWHFYLFAICMVPMILFFLSWMIKVWKNESNANFKNSLVMNILAALCTVVCFLTIIIINNI
ncbi:MAG: UbiA family prenyltransferase [Bacteroidota bacterium]|nr:UbiA family prenyltransferase [Bacteroidota bacterium]